METIKKTFKQVLTTGATTDHRAGYYLIIPDTGVTYSMKLLLTSDVTDIGFLDPIDSISGDTIYYDISYGDYRCVKINQSDTIIYGIIYGDYVCSMVDAESALTVDIKYLCPTGLTNGLAGIYNINSSTHNIAEYEIEHIKTLIVNNGVVTFNMFNVEFIVNDVLRPHYQRYSINNGIWIDNTNNSNSLTFDLTGDTILNVELYNDICVPTTTVYSPTTTVYSPTTTVYSPTTTVYSPTTTVYSPTTTVYTPTTTVYTPTTTVYTPTTTVYIPTTTVCTRPEGIEGAWVSCAGIGTYECTRFSSVTDAGNKWKAFKAVGGLNSVISNNFNEYTALELGVTVYNLHGTDCDTFPDGYYWYFESGNVLTYFLNATSITIVTVTGGVITGIDTCESYGLYYNGYCYIDELVSSPIHTTNAHIPTFIEFSNLVDFVGGQTVAGGKLKEVGTEHWTTPNTAASDSFGFKALPSGYIQSNGIGIYKGLRSWYPPYEAGPNGSLITFYDSAQSSYDIGRISEAGYTIRLIVDTPDAASISGNMARYTGNDGQIYPCVLINGLWWLARNLAEKKFQDGTTIPIFTNSTDWAAATGAGAGAAYWNYDPTN